MIVAARIAGIARGTDLHGVVARLAHVPIEYWGLGVVLASAVPPRMEGATACGAIDRYRHRTNQWQKECSQDGGCKHINVFRAFCDLREGLQQM